MFDDTDFFDTVQADTPLTVTLLDFPSKTLDQAANDLVESFAGLDLATAFQAVHSAPTPMNQTDSVEEARTLTHVLMRIGANVKVTTASGVEETFAALSGSVVSRLPTLGTPASAAGWSVPGRPGPEPAQAAAQPPPPAQAPAGPRRLRGMPADRLRPPGAPAPPPPPSQPVAATEAEPAGEAAPPGSLPAPGPKVDKKAAPKGKRRAVSSAALMRLALILGVLAGAGTWAATMRWLFALAVGLCAMGGLLALVAALHKGSRRLVVPAAILAALGVVGLLQQGGAAKMELRFGNTLLATELPTTHQDVGETRRDFRCPGGICESRVLIAAHDSHPVSELWLMVAAPPAEPEGGDDKLLDEALIGLLKINGWDPAAAPRTARGGPSGGREVAFSTRDERWHGLARIHRAGDALAILAVKGASTSTAEHPAAAKFLNGLQIR